jgi:hypothetical protein
LGIGGNEQTGGQHYEDDRFHMLVF